MEIDNSFRCIFEYLALIFSKCLVGKTQEIETMVYHGQDWNPEPLTEVHYVQFGPCNFFEIVAMQMVYGSGNTLSPSKHNP